MKTPACMVLVLLFILASPMGSLAGEEIDWFTDLEEARKKSLSENKLILADFGAKWCGPCKRMDLKTWLDSAVVEQSSRVVCLKVDTDTNHALAKQYGIRSIPAMLIFDGHGTELTRITGYKDAEQMVSLLKALPDSVVSIHLAANRLAEDPENLDLQLAVAYQYRQAGFYEKSNEALMEMEEALTADSPPELRDRINTFCALNYLLLGQTKKAWKQFIQCVEDHPDSEYRPLQLFSLVKAGQELKKKREVQEYLQMLRTEFPGDKHTAWANELVNH